VYFVGLYINKMEYQFGVMYYLIRRERNIVSIVCAVKKNAHVIHISQNFIVLSLKLLESKTYEA